MAKNVEYRQGIAVYRVSNKSPRVPTSSYTGETQAIFYGFDMAGTSKDPLSELIFGNMGSEYQRTFETIIQTQCVK